MCGFGFRVTALTHFDSKNCPSVPWHTLLPRTVLTNELAEFLRIPRPQPLKRFVGDGVFLRFLLLGGDAQLPFYIFEVARHDSVYFANVFIILDFGPKCLARERLLTVPRGRRAPA